ncbi:MAG: flagellar hook-associated protein FlgL [Planctomycetota bacterium]
MLYRTTNNMINDRAMHYITQHNSMIATFQDHVSSGIRVNRPSDDPIAFRQISATTIELNKIRTEQTSISDAEAKLNASVTSLQQANDLLVRAKTLAQQGVQTTSAGEREAIAIEVEGMLDSLKNIATSQTAGEYLFGGIRSDQIPFQFDGPNVPGRTLTSNYLGDTASSVAFIGERISVETLISGDDVFGAGDRGEMLVLGSTGAATGVGTANVTGRASLEVRHTTTTYLGGSGIQPGLSSDSNDTLIGPAGSSQIEIIDQSGTGDFGTVRLNNGEEFSWTSSDTDLEVIDESNRKLFVDMSSITANFSGSVSFDSNASMSIDGFQSSVAVDFSASQTVVDSINQEQAHIDTTQIRETGIDHLEFPGTANAFQVFFDLTSDLRNSRDLDSVEYASSLDRRLGELNSLSDRILGVVGRQSASLQTLDELDNRLGGLRLEAERHIVSVQSTDIPNTVLQLQQHQSLLEFTYSVTASVASTNILDFLR